MTARHERKPSPFNDNAVSYHIRGWHPLPLWQAGPGIPFEMRPRGKSHPPRGFTGREGRNATREEIEAWRDSGRFYNIACRMPDTVIAIDVDVYHGGGETLAQLEKRLGKLPKTYTVTARSDGSGHRYYQVDGRRIWRNPGEGVEIIHWGWRYAVFPPSIHPETGTPYKWYGPDGNELPNQLGPRPDQLPPLPKKWVAYLDTGKDPRAPVRADLTGEEVRALVADWATDDEPCHHMQAALYEAYTTGAGGRHDACMRAQMRILRYGESGHPGARTAIASLRRWFFATAGAERDVTGEWTRGLVNAAQLIAADPTPDERWGCLPTPARYSRPVTLRKYTVPAPRTTTAPTPRANGAAAATSTKGSER